MTIPYKNVDESDLNKTVWRYLTFTKFISLLAYRAIWFSKLNSLIDKFEGSMPRPVDEQMILEFQGLKKHFAPSLHDQIDGMNKRNVDSGRELTVVNCWFLADAESEHMWEQYAKGSEGIAIRSTIRALSQYVACDPRVSYVGKVQYVDLNSHAMSPYEANQAHERAFLKDLQFTAENEVRIATMNFKGAMCVSMEGTVLTPEEYQGAKMNNFENPGLYIQVALANLIEGIVIAPGAAKWFEHLVRRIVQLSSIGGPVVRSKLE